MEKKTLVWDVDGVLIWHHPTDPRQDWRKALIKAGLLNDWEGFQKSEEWKTCITGKSKDTRKSLTDFLERSGKNKLLAPDMIRLWLEGNTQPNTAVIQKLKSLHNDNFSCIIASNQDHLRGQWLAAWLDEQLPGNIPRFISCDLGAAKPDQDFFLEVQKSLQCQPDDLFLIDDTYPNIVAANALGWNVLHFQSGSSDISEIPF